MITAWRRFLALFTSLRLTVVLLVLSILLIFAATLDQVHLGVWGVQQKYFHSFFVFTQIPGTDFSFPIFPAGYLLGGVVYESVLSTCTLDCSYVYPELAIAFAF